MNRLIIILTYGTLFFLDISGKVSSIFVYLFAMQIELVMLLFQFIMFNASAVKKNNLNVQNVLIGAIPLFLFNYFIIYFAALEFDQIDMSLAPTNSKVYYPIVFYGKQLIYVTLGLVAGKIYNQLTSTLTESIISKMVKQALKIWVLGIVAILVMVLINKEYYWIAITALPLARISLELNFNKANTVSA